MTVKCAICKQLVPPDHTVTFWPLSDTTDVRNVHRPDITATCFRAAVGDVWTHGIAAAPVGE